MIYIIGKTGNVESCTNDLIDIIKRYNPILTEKGRAQRNHLWMSQLTDSDQEIKSGETPFSKDEISDDIFIDGYVIYGEKCFSNKSSKNDLTFLKQYIKQLIDNNKYAEFNNFCGSFLIILMLCDVTYFISDNITSKPMYYCSSNKVFTFSNDLRLLLCDDIELKVNQEKCKLFCSSNYAIFEMDNDEQTFFDNIFKINSGSIISVKTNGDIAEIDYFSKYAINKIAYTDEDCCKIFREKLNCIIQCATQNTIGNIGVSLSGGIDSAVVLASLIDLGLRDRIIAYHISFRNTNLHQCSDYKLVTTLIHDMGIKGRVLYADDCVRFKNSGSCPDKMSFIDGPVIMGNELSYDFLAPVLRKDDVSVMFTGDGGDYMFMGTKYCGDYFIKTKRFHEALIRAKRLAKNSSYISVFKSYVIYNIIPLIPLINKIKYNKIFWGDVKITPPTYITRKIEKIAKNQRKRTLKRTKKHLNTWYRQFVYDFMFPKAPYVGVNVDSFSFSLPLEDNLMFQTVMAFPPQNHYDIFRGWQGEYRIRKMILRKAFSDILPDYITKQKNKTNYVNMFTQTFRNDAENIQKMICSDRKLLCAKMNIIKEDEFKAKIQSVLDMSQDPNFYGGEDINYYMNIIKLELWLEVVEKGKDYLLRNSQIGALYNKFIDMEEI